MQIKIKSIAALLTAGLLVAGAGITHAATITNADTSATLNLGTAWVGGVVPTAANVAVWDSTVQANLSKTLGASTAWAGIQELNPGGPVVINADGNSLTLGASGIDLSLATNSLTLDNPVVLGAIQTWNVTNGQTLTVGGAISGSSWLTLNNGGSGTITLPVANSYSGGTVINSGFVVPYVITSFGSGEITNNGGDVQLVNFTHGGILTNPWWVTGTSLLDVGNANASFVLNGAWSGPGAILITNDTASGSTLTFGGASSTANLANFTGSIIVVSNASGTASAGTLRFNNGGAQDNTGSAAMSINLGTNSTIALVNRDAGTTSIGELTGGPGTAVKGQTSGSGTEIWSIGGKNTSVTFAGTFENNAANQLVALTKVGTGTFTLTGTNTFTGAVTISAGVLQIGDGGADGVLGGGAIVNNASLVFNRSDSFTTLANAISGTGSLVFEGGGTNTFNGADTSSGSTIISNADLILGGSATISGPISVENQGTLDVSQNPAFTLNQTLSGSGSVTGLVTAVGGSINPGGAGTFGTLSFISGLTESGGVNNQFALSAPGGTNDLINVVGNLSLSGTNYIALAAFGGGTVPVGTYPLFAYSGTLTGGVTNFLVTAAGVTGTVTNLATTPPEIAVVVTPTQRGATNLFWKGDGVANNWDLVTSNWFNGPTRFNFQTGDHVNFTDAGAPNTTVNLNLSVAPSSVVVSNTQTYSLNGNGSISGATGLVKTNSGLFAVATTNSYTGSTVVGGGTLQVFNVANGGSASAIGAAISNPTNLVFYGSTLAYAGPSAATDRGATLNGAGATFDVIAGSDLTLNGTLTGPGALTQVDGGTLTLPGVNTYAGGTVLAGGVLALGSDIANNNGAGFSAFGSTNDPVIFNGGTLQLYGVGSGTANNYNTFFNPLVVPAGQTGTLVLFPRGAINTGGGAGINANLSGSGTLNLVVNYVRDAVSGNWSAFSGLLLVSNLNASGDEFRINNNYGYANATIFLNGTFTMDSTLTAGATINIGSLGGISSAIIGAGSESEPGPTWSVGWNNVSNIFAGTIEDDSTAPGGHTSVTKVGTATWYLSGQNTYTGNTSISNGVLALINNSTTGSDGSIADSTNIFINTGAALDLSATLNDNDTFYLASGQVLGGYGTLRGILDTTQGGTVTGGGGIAGGVGVLTVTNTINLGGVAWIKLDTSSSPNSDRLVSSTAGVINLGGTLVLTNIGPRLQVGDTFTLFSAPSLTGSFGTLVLPNYYTWNTSQLAVNGTVSVTGVSAAPVITSVDFSQLANGTVTLNSANGLPSGPATVLSTTNLALPVGSWTTAATGNFDSNGNLNIPVTVDPTLPQQYFILQSN